MRSISRRAILGQTTGFAGALLAGPSLAVATETAVSDAPGQARRRLKLVVTGGHPGDPEYGCGGTIARCTEVGHDAILLYLNRGESPGRPKEFAATRVMEAAKACKILKARPLYAGQVDAQAVVDPAHYAAFKKILESEQPDVVFTHWPIDNHADHRAISMLVYDAWLRMEKRFALFYYEVSNGEDTVHFTPNQYVDITNTEPRKRLACYAHASQSPDKFYALQSQVARFRGIESGYRIAEAFVRHVQSIDSSLLGG
jgi:LmbE family N-acetylglucosaminyl deacetylase